MKKVAILIPVYNNLAFTKKCIQELRDLLANSFLKHSSFDLVVIDDGSSDGTGDWVQQNHPELILLQGDGNLWWSGGINLGARHAIAKLKADQLLLWNNDIRPAKDYFEQLDELMEELDGRTIAGSKILYEDPDKSGLIWSFGGYFNPRNGKKSMLGYNQPDKQEFSIPKEVDWLPGMGTLVPVEIVQTIGYWDEQVFPQYHGDSDFTFRAKTAGFAIVAYPQLRLWNDKSSSGLKHGGTLKGLSAALVDRRSNSNLRDNFRFYQRHATSILAYQDLLVYYLNYFGGFVKWKILSLFGRKKVDH
jgi:GT2 family glycosyltransferase